LILPNDRVQFELSTRILVPVRLASEPEMGNRESRAAE
jgi:hypothetical protein